LISLHISCPERQAQVENHDAWRGRTKHLHGGRAVRRNRNVEPSGFKGAAQCTLHDRVVFDRKNLR
jgi:hypothetical protein